MRRIDKLLVRAVIGPFVIAAVVLTFVVFAHDMGRLSELLITRNASVESVLLICGSILPGILIFALPLAYVIGLLIGLSGLSSESQIIALRACGVPLRRLLIPVMLLGAIVGVATGVLSIYVLPGSMDLLRTIKEKVSLRQATSQIEPRVFNEDFPNIVFYLDDLSVDRQRWDRVFLADNSDAKRPRIILAREGTWVTDQEAARLQLHLRDGTVYQIDPQDSRRDNVSVFSATDIPVDLRLRPGLSADNGSAEEAPRKAPELSTLELWRGTGPGTSSAERLEQLIQLHRRLSIPFSVVPFGLLGLTFGASMKKGGRTSGFVLSLALVLTFFVLFMNGLRLASVGSVSPWLGAWAANIILSVIGFGLLANAERTSSLLHGLAGWHWKPWLISIGRAMHFAAIREKIRRADDAVIASTSRITRIRFPRIIDTYVTRSFLMYFLWSAIACGTLFIVLTVFDLLDDIIRNRIPVIFVIQYLFFLAPQVLMLVVPMSVLLAILISFGILEKHSEVTALKAGGWSLYRIALPVVLVTSMVCAGLYFLQDRILPHANVRQDSLRHVIKGRPAQTFMRPQRKWILGEKGRIFNYEYFDASRSIFVGLNVFETDFNRLTLLRRLHASRAVIGSDGRWTLEKGWIRDFKSETGGFKAFHEESAAFPEKASYFQKEIFEPEESSKLTYLELSNYISYLHKSGYNATELQVELNKKISFPLSCMVMALIGLPFSFSMGKKGAFVGITVSVVIAISYWGMFSVFEQMGAYGMLVPLLAAWAPNILFSAAGLFLLLLVRT
jgi:LPS export ABC transporter permease LptG/LPS export ABC transporter permease LptF